MKITKQQLRQIIQEELLQEVRRIGDEEKRKMKYPTPDEELDELGDKITDLSYRLSPEQMKEFLLKHLQALGE